MARVQMLMEAGSRRRIQDLREQVMATSIGMGGGEKGKKISDHFPLPEEKFPDDAFRPPARSAGSFDKGQWW